ncbi:hypothetical protein [Caballeronia ptereochthonis]|uniref:Uncharacterized protein n=1 Tax=Caballeronia ptereochthonis TaxID=1777144 RepID=A0A158D4X8_9BURK|nr:hypothetical protein [Caballeronia ptereochthonis]SAK89702.1 hypothetical protein AWB83_05052 [Caballeronia ptereochthonis]
MRASVLVSLRAHVVLIASCVATSDAAWLTACGCAGHAQALESTAVRAATLVSAAAIALIVRRTAKLAFDAARASRRIAWTADRLVIAGPCPRDWLVQLHAELHPAVSRQGAAHSCPRSAASCRVPRGRV